MTGSTLPACATCPVERSCHYPYKPCACVDQRKFWTAENLCEYQRNYPVPPTAQEQWQMFVAECGAANKVFAPGGAGLGGRAVE